MEKQRTTTVKIVWAKRNENVELLYPFSRLYIAVVIKTVSRSLGVYLVVEPLLSMCEAWVEPKHHKNKEQNKKKKTHRRY
jgi:hypothetical protein